MRATIRMKPTAEQVATTAIPVVVSIHGVVVETSL